MEGGTKTTESERVIKRADAWTRRGVDETIKKGEETERRAKAKFLRPRSTGRQVPVGTPLAPAQEVHPVLRNARDTKDDIAGWCEEGNVDQGGARGLSQ